MNLIVCGGRYYSDREKVFRTLDAVNAKREITAIIEGGATGADKLAGEWADERGIFHITAHANWKTNGKAAGPIRNKAMIEIGGQGVVAFPGGHGTRDMVRQAKKAGLTVMEVAP